MSSVILLSLGYQQLLEDGMAFGTEISDSKKTFASVLVLVVANMIKPRVQSLAENSQACLFFFLVQEFFGFLFASRLAPL